MKTVEYGRALGPVVLGAACGYSVEALQPFFCSVSRAMPESLLVLFTAPGGVGKLSGVEMVNPADTWVRYWLRQLPRGTRLASAACLHAGERLRRFSRLGPILQQAAWGVAVARYFWYRDWLAANPGDRYQPILLTDTRDVVFQRDPFLSLPNDRLFCGVEPICMAECMINSVWYREAYCRELLERIAEEPVLCSGVIGGPRYLVARYLEAICLEIQRIGFRILWSSGYDQAVHNHLLRNTPLGQAFQYEPWDSDRLTTMHYATPSHFKLSVDGDLLGPTGKVIGIVHQYDRHEHLAAWASRRWSDEGRSRVEAES